MFGRRPDGTLVRDAAPLRRFMPFISPRRNDSLVLLSQELVVEEALRFVEQRDGIWMTFSAKKCFSEEGELTTVKRRVDPHASLDDWVDHLLGASATARASRRPPPTRRWTCCCACPRRSCAC